MIQWSIADLAIFSAWMKNLFKIMAGMYYQGYLPKTFWLTSILNQSNFSKYELIHYWSIWRNCWDTPMWDV